MGTDAFAFAVYGIQLRGPAEQRLRKLLQEAQERLEASDEDIGDHGSWDDVPESDRPGVLLERVPPGELEKIRAAIGAPPTASLHYTGSRDDRPGRCGIEAGTWVMGFDLEDMAEMAKSRFSPTSDVRLHTWCELG